MTIQELASKASVTTRTIRYYTEQGLLPAPRKGRPAEYGEEHLRRLDLIRRLKEQYLPLDEIRDTFARLTLDRIEELLAGKGPQAEAGGSADERPGSAADYIAHILAHNAGRELMKRQSYEATPAYSDPGEKTVAFSPPQSFAPPPTPSPTSAPAQQAPRKVSLRAVPVEGTSMLAGGEASSAEETWRRVTLAPGIELHYRQTDDADFNHSVAHLLEAASGIPALHASNMEEKLK